MSVYSRKGRGWKYDFTLAGQRHTSKYYKTKGEAKQAEARRREELTNPQPELITPEKTRTDMAFLELVNKRLDHVKAYNSARHYEEYVYVARRWIDRWGKLACSRVTQAMVEKFILERSEVSAYTANKEIRYLRAAFNFGLKKGLVSGDPTKGLDFLPVERRVKYVPTAQDIAQLLAVAKPDTRDYLWTIRDTLARVSEVNALTWDDLDLRAGTIILYTRKKRGGHRTPRVIPMTDRLRAIMSRRFQKGDTAKPWIFWSRYWDRKGKCWKEGPYRSRHALLRKLCDRAGVKRFGFHALRHAGASLLDQERVPLGTIQQILGHENRVTTEIYLHSMGESVKAAMAVFESASGGFGENPHPNPHPNGKTGRRLKLVKG